MKNPPRIRILSVDDHPLVQEGIATVINSQPDMMLVAQAATGAEAIVAYRLHEPDVALMDLRLPDMSGIDAMIAIRGEFPAARIIVLTTFEGDVDIQRALQAGARSYVLKSTPPRELLEVIRQIHAGKKRFPAGVAAVVAEHIGEEALTPRELEVMELLAAGRGNREIARRLYISEETAKVHVRHILEKLGAGDRTQAVVIAIRRGIVRL